MSKGLKKGRLSPLGAAMAHLRQGRFAQVTKMAKPNTLDPAGLARTAGDRGTSAAPMDNGQRALAYQRQRDGALQLTDRQRRRLRKNVGRIRVEPTPLTGTDLDRYYAAQRPR